MVCQGPTGDVKSRPSAHGPKVSFLLHVTRQNLYLLQLHELRTTKPPY